MRRLPQDLLDVILDKLDILNAANALNDLRSPPGNRLEAFVEVCEYSTVEFWESSYAT